MQLKHLTGQDETGIKNIKIIHHRGTEDTEKGFVLLTAPQAQLTK
jgi:hypothetical protein